MNILPYPLEYSTPFSFAKYGKYKKPSSIFGVKHPPKELGNLPTELEDARKEVVGIGISNEDRLKKIREYISKFEAFQKLLDKNNLTYDISWEWSSYYYNKKAENVDKFDIEKAMLLIPLVFKFVDECREANHLEPILSGSSLGQKRLDDKLIPHIIANYKIAKEILNYILDLNIEESKFPELNKIYLRGLLYYIQGLQMVFVGYGTGYKEDIKIALLDQFINVEPNQNVRGVIKYDDGILGKFYATAAIFLGKANIQFRDSHIQADPSLKALADPLNDNCSLLAPFFESMSFFLYGIPTINLFEFNSVEKENGISRIRLTLNARMDLYKERLKYILKIKSYFVKVLNKYLYTRDAKVKEVMDYYYTVFNKVETVFNDIVTDENPNPIFLQHELDAEIKPLLIPKAKIESCNFAGFEYYIPDSMIRLPQPCQNNQAFNTTISLLFPDIPPPK